MNLLRKAFARQFRKPSGLLGHFAASFMRKNNQEQYRYVVELLRVQGNAALLEVGCGEGNVIRLITSQCSTCTIDGLDFSRLMLRKARRNNIKEINEGRVRLLLGDLKDYDFNGTSYSQIFAINVLYFWNNLSEMFAKLYGILEPGGRLVLFMSSPDRLNQIPLAVDGVFNKYPLEVVLTELKSVGFSDIDCKTVLKQGLLTYCLCAGK